MLWRALTFYFKKKKHVHSLHFISIQMTVGMESFSCAVCWSCTFFTSYLLTFSLHAGAPEQTRVLHALALYFAVVLWFFRVQLFMKKYDFFCTTMMTDTQKLFNLNLWWKKFIKNELWWKMRNLRGKKRKFEIFFLRNFEVVNWFFGQF